MPKLLTIEDVIARFRNRHGDRYDYCRVQYQGSAVNVEIICKRHGVFSTQPQHHWKDVGCKLCAFEERRISKSEFEERAKKHFCDRYDYSHFSELPPFGKKVPILCRIHGILFQQEARNHMKGHLGCPKCKSLNLSGPADTRGTHRTEASLTSAFVEKAKNVHGERYDYSRFNYTTLAGKGTIICRQHGEFQQCPSNHLCGSDCPICARESLREGSFKQRCKKLGIDYWRALKRRETGAPDEKIFAAGYIRTDRKTSPVILDGVEYPNLLAAVRAMNPPAPASPKTIARWLRKGVSPEEAFKRMPKPGYANGIVYLVTHVGTGKKYVGNTIQSLEERWGGHIQQSKNKSIKSARSLHAAIRLHGACKFTIEKIDSGDSISILGRKEREWIKTLNTLVPNGFNISTGGTTGGSNSKPTTVDGQKFLSVRKAAAYIAETRGVSREAAEWRLRNNKIDARKPAAKGQSLVKTAAYKAWSQIVHGVLNPKSKSYRPSLTIYKKWKSFDSFFEDVGQPPQSGMAFARRDKSQGYFPENCIWMSKSEASKINAVHMKTTGTLVGRRGKCTGAGLGSCPTEPDV